MSEASKTIDNLLISNPLREPLIEEIVRALRLPHGGRGLDAGCGIGRQAIRLGEAVGPLGQVCALDVLPELLAFGQEHLRCTGCTQRIDFCAGDAGCLPLADCSFDWVWSADCIGYPLGDLGPGLKELMRVLRPGGSVILLAWSSQQLLPGYPVLEARLNATCSAYLPYFKDADPALNFMRALRPMRAAGLQDVRAQTFVRDVQAPLSREIRLALVALFEMLWGQRQPEAAQEDWDAYQRLCTPGSPDFVLDLPEYAGFFTYTVFRGVKL